MKILFLTRSYPPTVGGMEIFNFNLITGFKRINKEIHLIANIKGKKNVPIFFISSFFKSLVLIRKNKIEHLHIGDSLLSPIGVLLRKITGVKTSINVYGLDITFPNKPYQAIIPYFVRKVDKVICISEATQKECIKRGISSQKCVVVPCGINPEEFQVKNRSEVRRKTRAFLSKQLSVDIKNKKILLTVGRLVKRKGHQWFVGNVMSKLPKDTIYLIAGDGPEKEKIIQEISKNNLENRVLLLGRISDELKKNLYNSADLFIMPNINVKGDMEGFGIVAIEAGSVGLETIASNTEGIRDAIINSKTGWLVKTKNSEEFIKKINAKRLDKGKIEKTVTDNFSWGKIIEKYEKYFYDLQKLN